MTRPGRGRRAPRFRTLEERHPPHLRPLGRGGRRPAHGERKIHIGDVDVVAGLECLDDVILGLHPLTFASVRERGIAERIAGWGVTGLDGECTASAERLSLARGGGFRRPVGHTRRRRRHRSGHVLGGWFLRGPLLGSAARVEHPDHVSPFSAVGPGTLQVPGPTLFNSPELSRDCHERRRPIPRQWPPERD